MDPAKSPSQVFSDLSSPDQEAEQLKEPFSTADHYHVRINHSQKLRFVSNKQKLSKYTVTTFIPLFLFAQVRKLPNIYFLLIAILQQIPDISPTGRWGTILTLVFLWSISGVKEIFEDLRRYRNDECINNRKTTVFRGKRWKKIFWQDVRVGDIVEVLDQQNFPADMVMLASSEPLGIAYIETASLDGETNLKIRQSLPQTNSLDTDEDFANLRGVLECEYPDKSLYKFDGNFLQDNEKIPIGPAQILLRGSTLINTEWAIGVVISTGSMTKQLLNNVNKIDTKSSNYDRIINRLVLIMFGILLFLCLMSAGFSVLNYVGIGKHWYLALDDDKLLLKFIFSFIRFIILYHNMIPISLLATLEIVRCLQAFFIIYDDEMFSDKFAKRADVHNSTLNELLGQVKFIFSDKTGTLTLNTLSFRMCSINGTTYSVDNPQEMVVDIIKSNEHSFKIKDFLTIMAACHTVIPHKDDDGNVSYFAGSPDEKALIHGARIFGTSFKNRTDYSVIMEDYKGRDVIYDVLHVIEYSSYRKRMSVLVRSPDKKIKLYMKGADSVVYERLAEGQTELKDITTKCLESFASTGLRTICFAMKVISQEEYDEWRKIYSEAVTSIHNRDMLTDSAAELIEKDLTLLGVTAVEDQLQPNVMPAISSLLAADIHVWVLSGDRQENAVSAGKSSGLIREETPLLVLTAESAEIALSLVKSHVEKFKEQGILKLCNDVALVLDGHTLENCINNSRAGQQIFCDLCLSCKSVICYRVEPLQKAELVKMIKTLTGSVTLAIGDGSNDVPMIQTADIGVGISGIPLERVEITGHEAAYSADYTIGEFRGLPRLLFVHGSWNCIRLARLILYSFYKNVCFYLIELWYALYSHWSGQVLFEAKIITLYNLMFTMMPPLALSLFDRYCSDDVMITNPALYKSTQKGYHFNYRVFALWMFPAVYHSIILFFCAMFSMDHEIIWGSGKTGGYLTLGKIIYTYLVVTVCVKACLETNAWTLITHVATWGSIFLWFFAFAVYSYFWVIGLPFGSSMTGLYILVYTSPMFWIGLVFIPFVALLPDLIFKVITRSLNPNQEQRMYVEMLRHKSKKKKLKRKEFQKNRSKILKILSESTSLQQVNLSRGYAFSEVEEGIVRQQDCIKAYASVSRKGPRRRPSLTEAFKIACNVVSIAAPFPMEDEENKPVPV